MALKTTPGALALYGVLGYLAWLRFGTRANPPVSYEDYKTGLTFADVREMLGHEQDAAYNAGQYMFVSRATVLGRWHQLKKDQYARYLDAYEQEQAAADEGLPF